MTASLFFRLASIATLTAIWVFSFLPNVGMPHVPGTDKWHHGLAYFTCMFFWGQWFIRPASRLKLAMALILIGALIECLQGLTSYRRFEWLDIAANATGVALAWLTVTVQLAVQRRFANGRGLTRPR